MEEQAKKNSDEITDVPVPASELDDAVGGAGGFYQQSRPSVPSPVEEAPAVTALSDEELGKIAGGVSVAIGETQNNVTTTDGNNGVISRLVQATINAVNQQNKGGA
jgi:hypothetical protein